MCANFYFDKTKIKSVYFLNYKGAEVAHNQCFYSEKIPVKAGDRTPESTAFVPSSAGLLISSYIIREFLGKLK